MAECSPSAGPAVRVPVVARSPGVPSVRRRGWLVEGAELDARQHDWVAERCTVCGLRRRQTWVLDDDQRAVMALVWSDARDRPVRAVVFPRLLGQEPVLQPRATFAQAHPDIPLGREPRCRPDRFR